MSNSKLPLTIVTAVLNESKNLPSFLNHVTNFAQEIIVIVDYRNTDNGAEIAKQYGCKVLFDKGESQGIVFNNKNRGAGVAKNEWVLILDPDERMDDNLKTSISKIVLGDTKSKATIFQTSFLNYEFGKYFDKCDQKNKPFVRLFQKGKFSYQTGKTAEGFGIQSDSIAPNFIGKIMVWLPIIRSAWLKSDPNIANLSGYLIHNSHPNLEDFIKKIDLYSAREAKILFSKNKKRPNSYFVFNLLVAPFKEFMYKFFIWKMYKEGIHGYIAASTYAFYHFLVFAKYFALYHKHSHAKEIEKANRKYNFPED